MKKLPILIAFLSFSITIKSQTYIPLLNESNTWNVVAAGFMYEPYYDTVYQTITYTVEGDTVINSQVYKMIYASWQEEPTEWGLNCFMKEDDDGKVWTKSTITNQEYLSYDFSLEQGQTALIGPYGGLTAVVDSVTTVDLGGERKKLWIHYEEMPDVLETWTEGIGSNKGLVWSGEPIVGGFYELLCFSQNDVVIYQNPYYSSCYIYTVDINEIIDNDINIYPNPAKGLLYINNINRIRINSIMITDLNGKTVKDYNTSTGTLDISSLNPGLYFINISTGKGQIIKKIMVE